VAAVVPDAMCDRPSRQEHAEQATDGLHHDVRYGGVPPVEAVGKVQVARWNRERTGRT
jgi:hypothetical protein